MILTILISIKHTEYTNHLIFEKFKYPNKTYTLILKVGSLSIYGSASFILLKDSLSKIILYSNSSQNYIEAITKGNYWAFLMSGTIAVRCFRGSNDIKLQIYYLNLPYYAIL